MSPVLSQAGSFLKEKKLRMIWEISKHEKISYLAGTAHFFPYSFKRSLSAYIEKVDTVLIEGPLDEDTMAKVAEAGRLYETDRSLQEVLSDKTKEKLTKALISPFRCRSTFFRYYGHIMEKDAQDSLDRTFSGLKPWLAFFSIWYQYLRLRGWAYSMDKDVYRIAREMGKNVSYLEDINEQISALELIPVERIVGFLDKIDNWKEYTNKYVKIFLKGELELLMTNAEVFPTRCKAVIEDRDIVLYGRMKNHLEKGIALVCVGITHVQGVRKMLVDEGFSIFQIK